MVLKALANNLKQRTSTFQQGGLQKLSEQATGFDKRKTKTKKVNKRQTTETINAAPETIELRTRKK